MNAFSFRGLPFFLTAVLFTVSAAAVAQEASDVDGVRWFDGYDGRELVIRGNRFMLTDYAVKATFRGTFERDGAVVIPTLDLRTTTFLIGPMRDIEKLSYINHLKAAGKLPVFLVVSSSCEKPENDTKPTLTLQVVENYLRLDWLCGIELVRRFGFQRVIPKE